jgi:predicted nucleotidyltransferase
MESPFAVLSQITRALEEQNIAYVVVGSFASSLRGMYRTTGDVDIVASIKPEHVGTLIASLQDQFYIDEQAVLRAVRDGRSFNAIHFDSVFKVDIFVSHNDFSQQQLRRRQPEKLSAELEQTIYVATAEDTILAKLKWYRAGGEISSTQWRDVLGIIGTQGQHLDVDYLREWADKLSIRDLLEKILDEASS